MIKYNKFSVVSHDTAYVVTRVAGVQPDVKVGDVVEFAVTHEDVNHPDFKLVSGITVHEVFSVKEVMA